MKNNENFKFILSNILFSFVFIATLSRFILSIYRYNKYGDLYISGDSFSDELFIRYSIMNIIYYGLVFLTVLTFFILKFIKKISIRKIGVLICALILWKALYLLYTNSYTSIDLYLSISALIATPLLFINRNKSFMALILFIIVIIKNIFSLFFDFNSAYSFTHIYSIVYGISDALIYSFILYQLFTGVIRDIFLNKDKGKGELVLFEKGRDGKIQKSIIILLLFHFFEILFASYPFFLRQIEFLYPLMHLLFMYLVIFPIGIFIIILISIIRLFTATKLHKLIYLAFILVSLALLYKWNILFTALMGV